MCKASSLQQYLVLPSILLILLSAVIFTTHPATGIVNATILSPSATSPQMNVTKSIKALVFQESSQYLVTYQIDIQNTGNIDLRKLQATDNLSQAFQQADSNKPFTVQRLQGSGLTVNPEFNGRDDTNLLMENVTLGAGASGTITFDVLFTIYRQTINVENTVFVKADNSAQVSASVRFDMAEPLMEATMDANSDDVAPGEEIRYTINIENFGVGSATDVIVTTTPDARTKLIHDSVRTNRGTVVTGDQTGDTQVKVRISSIPAYQFARITFSVRVQEGILPVGTHILSAQGQISGNNFERLVTDDSNTDELDDATTTEVRVEQLPLQATMLDTFVASDSPANSVQAGSLITYTTVLENQGEVDTAEDVVFSVTPDANTELLSESLQTSQGSFTAGAGVGDTEIALNAGDIAASEAVTVSFTVRVREGVFPVGNHTLSLQGDVTSSNFLSVKTDDPDTPTENDATVTDVEINSFPLRAKMTVTHIPNEPDDNEQTRNELTDLFVRPGDTISYTILLENQGIDTAEDVVFSFTPETYTTLLRESLQTSQGEFIAEPGEGDTVIVVRVGDIAPGDTPVTISFIVRINKDGLPSNDFTLTSQGQVTSKNFLEVITDDPVTGVDEGTPIEIIVRVPPTAPNPRLYLPLIIR